MRIIEARFFQVLIFCTASVSSYAQGCSDAGVCTLDGAKPFGQDSVAASKNMVKVGLTYGQADHSISTLGNYIEYSRFLNDKIKLNIKLTSLAQSGNEVSAFGLSDVFVTGSYRVFEGVNFIGGVKLPLTDGNTMENDLALPMDYQSSLGTVDMVLGLSYNVKYFQVSAALQQPLTQNNNQFMADVYPEDSKLATIQNTDGYNRSGDVLLRVSYTIKLTNKLNLVPSVLPIYHLGKDQYTNALGEEVDIENSQGLTLNGNLFVNYQLTQSSAVELSYGTPFVTRNARPDGLTRSMVLNLEYRVGF